MATAANTPTQYYLSNKDVAGACEKDFKKIDKECAPKESREPGQHPVLNKLLGKENTQKLEAMAAKIKGDIPTTGDNAWMSHCDGLWIKPASVGKELQEFNQMFQSMSNDLNSALKNIVDPMVNELKNAAETEATNYAENQAKQALLREGGEIIVGGGPEDPIGDIVAGIDRLVTIYKVATFSPEVLDKLKDLMSFKDLATKAMGEMQNLASNVGNMSPTQAMASGMGVLARINPCTRARRCKLVPYGKTGTAESLGGHGCCSGQTGHHILPDEMTKDGNCPGYDKDQAPTICVEGTNNSNGTHGQIHDVLVLQMQKFRAGGFFGSRTTMDYDTARNKGVTSVMATFPESRCSKRCLAAQLDAYYKNKCTKDLPALAGKKFSSTSNDDTGR